MSIIEGRWRSPDDAEDEQQYPNYHSVAELGALCGKRDFDLVVVGGGGSGAVAAIEAADRGASVIVLEKTSTPGGSTQQSGGSIRLVTDPTGTIEHFWHLAQRATPKEVIVAFVQGLCEVPSWIERLGGELVSDTEDARPLAPAGTVFAANSAGSSLPGQPYGDSLSGRAHLRPLTPRRPNGAALWDLLSRNLAERDVPVVLGAKVERLVQDLSRRAVTGVEVAVPNGTVAVRARRAVVLCSGGFARDEELLTQYLGVAVPTLGPVGRATGDGVRMAQDVGADLWHMSAVAASIGFSPDGLAAGFYCNMPADGFAMVDQRGRRFVNETALENHSAIHAMIAQDPYTGEFLRNPSFIILDDETRRAGRLIRQPNGENRRYPWSADNSVEISRGWISTGRTVRELAGLLGLPPDALVITVDAFNRCIANGEADEVGRLPSRKRPIATAPFYGAAVYPLLLNTQGGPRRDARGQIVRPDRSPIPGLFGAGELGSMWNRLYPGAGNISECVVSARLAVQSALE